MIASAKAQPQITYLDMQAWVGITKHNGGWHATKDLLSLCHIKGAQEVLNVGCGIGVGVAYIARTYGCHVVGIDLSEKMIQWSRQRAREEGVEDRVELKVGDILSLPFGANRFDVVICESVLAFVADKTRAISECVRVARPGGYVGLNETFLHEEPPRELVERMYAVGLGTEIPSAATWQRLWAESGLQDQVVSLNRIDPGREVKDRIQWVGWRWALRGWGRALRLYLMDPAARQSLKEQLNAPLDLIQQMGYGLFAGRKPETTNGEPTG